MKPFRTPPLSITLAACALLGTARAQTPAAAQPADDTGTPASLYFGDVDRDGLDDVFVVTPAGQVSLLLNRADGRYDDITLASGLAELEGGTCALFADFDGDGALDLFVGSSEKRIWRNLGNASFVALDSGIDHDLIDLAATAVDADKDGLLDLHLHTEAGDLLYRASGRGRFERIELPLAGHAAHVTTSVTGEESAGDSARPDAPNESPTRRRLRRWLRAHAAATDAGAGELDPSSAGSGGSGPANMLVGCPLSLDDLATAGCISASSAPALGTLYPLSTHFNLTAAGAIGMGTTAPLSNLDIVRPSARVRVGASGNNETAALTLVENNSDTSGFDVRYEGNLNQFQIAARDGSAVPVSRLAINRTNGNVGIGNTAPAQKLDVTGNALVSGSITGSTLASTVATGTAPLSVASTTKVSSLNADLIDGLDSTAFSQLGNSIESSEITNGTIAMADLGQNGASSGQTIKWNGSAWAPAADIDTTGPWSSSLGNTYVSSGNVGIGTSSPFYTLDVRSPASAIIGMESPNGASLSLTQFGFGFDVMSNSSVFAIGRHNVDWLFSFDYGAGNAWLANKLGIGTTTPGSPLTVAGTIESTSGGVKFPDGSVQTRAAYPGTQYLTLGPGDFVPLNSNDHVVNSWFDGVWAYSGELVAPLHLPDGAQVTSVRVIGFDTLATVDLIVEIDGKNRTATSSYVEFGHTYTAIGGYFDQTVAAAPFTIDNQNETRFFDVYPAGGAWPGTSALSIISIIVAWHMP
ncbi:MAG: VCBS repeat-containing protein [Planctomycetes bacterium]|nr:VCBS repeat-containing protein [Planctomycetota bacterium]